MTGSNNRKSGNKKIPAETGSNCGSLQWYFPRPEIAASPLENSGTDGWTWRLEDSYIYICGEAGGSDKQFTTIMCACLKTVVTIIWWWTKPPHCHGIHPYVSWDTMSNGGKGSYRNHSLTRLSGWKDYGFQVDTYPIWGSINRNPK